MLVLMYYERPETPPGDCPTGGRGGYTIYKSNKVCVGENVPAWLWSSVSALSQAGLMVGYIIVKLTSLLATELIQPRNNWTRWHHTSVRNHEGTIMIKSGKIRVATSLISVKTTSVSGTCVTCFVDCKPLWIDAGSQREELCPWQRSWGRRLGIRKGGIKPQESPWKSSSIYPHNQSLPTLLLCAPTYTSDFTGAVPHHLFRRRS